MPIPKLVVTVGLMAAQVALGMTRKIKGPRLDELNVTVADYGTPIPRFWGIRRFQTPIMWAEKLREVKKTSKTKGGKYTEYKYYGTWANLICDQEIDGITRIWFDKHLVYQSTGPGPIAAAFLAAMGQGTGAIVKLAKGRNYREYLGTESQLPDSRMEAWCEDRYGADSCPAYRGSAYVVFEDIPLEKLGNHVPQVTIEAVRVKTVSYPYETKSGSGSISDRFYFGASGEWMLLANSTGTGYWWNTASRTLVGASEQLPVLPGSVPNASISVNGVAWRIGYSTGLDGAGVYLFQTTPMGGNSYTAVSGYTSADFICTRALETNAGLLVYSAYEQVAGYVKGTLHIPYAQSARDFCVDADGNVAILFQPTGSSSDFTVVCNAGTFTITGSAAARSHPILPAYICHVSEYSHFLVVTDGYYYFIDDSTGTVKSSGTATWGAAVPGNQAQQNPSLSVLWSLETGNVVKRSLEDGSVLQSIPTTNWTVPGGVGSTAWAFDPLNNAMWINRSATAVISILYLDRISSAGVTLGTIVDEVSEWCGLTTQDTSQLTQQIDGYSVTQGSGKDMLAPLLDVHDVDARPHDFAVQFVNRGSAPSGSTILTEDFVRDGDSKRHTVTIQQDTDIPRRVTINFADTNKDQQTNTAIAQRPLDAVDSYREETIDLSTYVATPDTAQRLAERYFRRVWNSRERPKLSLTAQHLDLEPGDVKTISIDGVVRNVRLDRMTLRGSVLDCEWVRDETAFAVLNSSTGAEMEGRDDEEILVPDPTKGFVLDSPLINDAANDINPKVWVGAGGMGGTFWPGAVAFRGDDGTYDEIFAAIDSSQKAIWGFATAALATANPNLWDRGNTLSVNVFGTLTSSTEAAINADPSVNLIAIGDTGRWEYLNFATATLTGTSGTANTYQLSGLKRGRRGTEGNVGNHESGDAFILVSDLQGVELGTDEIGDDLSFKVQTVGRDVDATAPIDLDDYTGASLKPYAPARIKWTTDGTDMFGEIIRRTRVGGSWNGGSTIPLSENSEDYEVDILDGSGTVLRTITVTGTNTFTYTGAQITADGGSVGVEPSYNAYQLSDAVGRGFALAA